MGFWDFIAHRCPAAAELDRSAAEGSFNRHPVSRTRCTAMGVRIVVGEGEPIGLALRRLKKQLEREGVRFNVIAGGPGI